MSRAPLLLGMALMLAIAGTSAGLSVWRPFSIYPSQSEPGVYLAVGSISPCYNCSDPAAASSLDSPTSSQSATGQLLSGNTPIIATSNWLPYDEEEDIAVWRGKVRSRWENLGFDSVIFEFFIRMKGAKTRLSLLDALLTMPKDRMQLAHELGLDWKAVDYQIVRLNRYGLVHEDRVFGNVKLYGLTALGQDLLRLMKELDDGTVKDPTSARVPSPTLHDQAL
jgi:hypothetical protein